MYKDGILTISDWTKGQASNALQGNAVIRNCEIFETPGLLRIANRPINDGVSYGALPVARVKDKYGNVWVLTTGALFKNGSSYTGLNGTGYDLCIYKDYLFFSHGTSVGTVGPLAGPAVTELTTFSGLTSGYYHKLIVDENPDSSAGSYAVYVTNGNLISTIRNFTSQASAGSLETGLTLPDNEYAVTFDKVGNYLMIGTQTGSNYADRTNYRVANIYPWNKSTTDSFNVPVKLNEAGINAMISDGNKLYVSAGDRGNVYVANGSSYAKIKRIPWVENRSFSKTTKTYPNAMSFSQDGNLLIGTSTLTDSFSGDYDNTSRHGIYEIAVSDGYPAHLKYIISTGNFGSGQILNIGYIDQQGSDVTSIGWQDGSSYGVDATSFYTYTSYGAVFESGLFRVGTRLQRKTFDKLEFILTRPLVTGQGVRISYRKNLGEDYTEIGTFDYTTLGGVISHNTGALITDAETLQIKIELTQSGTDPLNNVNLLQVRIW